jgi:hypothetical protein
MAATDRVHYFHATADVLKAKFQRPLDQAVPPQAFASLREEGGYLSQRAEKYRLEGILSFRSAYTQVAGNKSPKPGHGWTTLATSVIEDLNVLDVVTADRVVGQVATEHPLEGYVPSVTFLGTRFENLKIGGHHVKPELNLDRCGPKPKGDAPYLEDPAFLNGVAQEYAQISDARELPDWARQKYHRDLLDVGHIKQQAEKAKVECSLVNRVGEVSQGRSFGHVIEVPGFGKISLAELTVDRDSFHLTMIRLDLGCVADGSGQFVDLKVNGHTKP